MTKIRMTYGGETATILCDLSQATAPLVVNGQHTQYQTADARHRIIYAVALACRVVWPEADWPTPAGGDVPTDWGNDSDAWAALAYQTVEL